MITHISFCTIPVTDQDRALAFWRDQMGLTVDTDAEWQPGQRWIMLRAGDSRTKLHLDLVDEMPEQSKPVLPLIDPDVTATIDNLRGQGVTIIRDPGPAEWDETTTYAMFRDSEGNLILLSSK